MARDNLVIEVKRSGGVFIMVISSKEVDIANCQGIDSAFVSNHQGGMSWVFDLSNVAFIDCSVVRSILKAARAINETGGKLAIISPKGTHPRKVLDLIGISRVSELFDEISSAKSALC